MGAVTLKPYPLGWKAKIGILLPAQDTGYGSYEFRLLCPDGVVTLETRVAGGKLTMDTLRRMREVLSMDRSCWLLQGLTSSPTRRPPPVLYWGWRVTRS